MSFEGSSLWRVRQKVGHDLLLWPGATVLLEDAEGRILLGLRRDNGEWAMPGGGAEEGGSFAATALDELREEVGLEADAADLVAFACVSEPADHLIPYPNGDLTHYFGIWFVLRRWRGEPEGRRRRAGRARVVLPRRAPRAVDAQLGRGAHALRARTWSQASSRSAEVGRLVCVRRALAGRTS